jgi:hypothetical protein
MTDFPKKIGSDGDVPSCELPKEVIHNSIGKAKGPKKREQSSNWQSRRNTANGKTTYNNHLIIDLNIIATIRQLGVVLT